MRRKSEVIFINSRAIEEDGETLIRNYTFESKKDEENRPHLKRDGRRNMDSRRRNNTEQRERSKKRQ